MKRITIKETDDYDKLVPMFIANDLEFGMDEPVPTDLAACFEMTDEDGNLEGGAVLAKRQGEYICDGIAVNEKYQKVGYGKLLLDELIKRIREEGGERIFLVARAPGFFRKQGFYRVDKDEAPMFFECSSCPQYGVTCTPEVMRRDV